MPARPEPADTELVLAAVANGDRGAFARLVGRHQSMVRAVLRRMAKGDHALADDLAQETFLLAWRNLAAFRHDARFSTWLYRIALNAWLSHARKRRESLQDDLDEVAAEAGPDPATPLADRVDLERAIATLSDGERAAIAACYYADLTHEEAAAALGMPLGTVKTHVLRAKAKLRARLGKEEP